MLPHSVPSIPFRGIVWLTVAPLDVVYRSPETPPTIGILFPPFDRSRFQPYVSQSPSPSSPGRSRNRMRNRSNRTTNNDLVADPSTSVASKFAYKTTTQREVQKHRRLAASSTSLSPKNSSSFTDRTSEARKTNNLGPVGGRKFQSGIEHSSRRSCEDLSGRDTASSPQNDDVKVQDTDQNSKDEETVDRIGRGDAGDAAALEHSQVVCSPADGFDSTLPTAASTTAQSGDREATAAANSDESETETVTSTYSSHGSPVVKSSSATASGPGFGSGGSPKSSLAVRAKARKSRRVRGNVESVEKVPGRKASKFSAAEEPDDETARQRDESAERVSQCACWFSAA